MKPTLRPAAIAVRSILGALFPLVALATPAPACALVAGAAGGDRRTGEVILGADFP